MHLGICIRNVMEHAMRTGSEPCDVPRYAFINIRNRDMHLLSSFELENGLVPIEIQNAFILPSLCLYEPILLKRILKANHVGYAGFGGPPNFSSVQFFPSPKIALNSKHMHFIKDRGENFAHEFFGTGHIVYGRHPNIPEEVFNLSCALGKSSGSAFN